MILCSPIGKALSQAFVPPKRPETPAGLRVGLLDNTEAPHNINDHESFTAEGVLAMITGAMAETGQNNVYYAGEPLVILGPEHAATIAADGLSKEDIRQILFEQSQIPLSRFSTENIERRLKRKFAGRFVETSLDAKAPVAQKPEDILIIVAGGPGKHSMYIPTFGGTRSVTRPIRHADGRPWSIADFDSIAY